MLDRGTRHRRVPEWALNRILPRALWSVLNPAEYARTIDRFQDALLAQPHEGLLFALSMLCGVCTFSFCVLMLTLRGDPSVIAVLVVVALALVSIGSAAVSLLMLVAWIVID